MVTGGSETCPSLLSNKITLLVLSINFLHLTKTWYIVHIKFKTLFEKSNLVPRKPKLGRFSRVALRRKRVDSSHHSWRNPIFNITVVLWWRYKRHTINNLFVTTEYPDCKRSQSEAFCSIISSAKFGFTWSVTSDTSLRHHLISVYIYLVGPSGRAV
jgi:hypothetical protein